MILLLQPNPEPCYLFLSNLDNAEEKHSLGHQTYHYNHEQNSNLIGMIKINKFVGESKS